MSRWRAGRSVGRTIYRDGVLVGLMDTPELAAEVVDSLNSPNPAHVLTSGDVRDRIIRALVGASSVPCDAPEMADAVMSALEFTC